MFCRNCGKEIDENADVCIHCGTFVKEPKESKPVDPAKTGWILAIICFFLGGLGIHRFMVGKIGTGILWIFTFGLLGIGVLVDFIMILTSSFTDKEGNKIELTP